MADDEELDEVLSPGQREELDTLTGFLRQIYGEGVVSAALEKYGSVRALMEETGAVQQCTKVIGAFKNGTECWICGFPITREPPGLRPECEHVLPIAQGSFLLSLYAPRKDASQEMELWKREYGWSHRTCNQVKGGKHFLKFDESSSGYRYAVDTDKLTAYLVELQDPPNRGKYDGGTGQLADVIARMNGTRVRGDSASTPWVKARLASMGGRLTSIIQRFGPGEQRLAYLASMASIIEQPTIRGIVEAPIPPAPRYGSVAKIDEVLAPLDDIAAEGRAKQAAWLTFQKYVLPKLPSVSTARQQDVANAERAGLLPGFAPGETDETWVKRQSFGDAVGLYKEFRQASRYGDAEIMPTTAGNLTIANIILSVPVARRNPKYAQVYSELERIKAVSTQVIAEKRRMIGRSRRPRKTRRHRNKAPKTRKRNPSRTHKRTL